MTPTDRFFEYARERHAIYHRRQMGLPRPFTEDKILREFRFCNVFRELDTTTIWLREHVRDPMRDRPEVLLAVVLYRWFNRIKTGEAIFQQTLLAGGTPFEDLLHTGSTDEMKAAILAYCGAGPYVTGSYIIKTPEGLEKLPGVLKCVRRFMKADPMLECKAGGKTSSWQEVARRCLALRDTSPVTLEQVWNWLRRHDHIGDFMAYEIVSDLRYTALLDRAPDIMTWANPGPGAMRGLNRIQDRDLDKKIPKAKYIEEMRLLLGESRLYENWPQWDSEPGAYAGMGIPSDMDPFDPTAWPVWDMRVVEHTLCEFDKYERVRLGQGAPRQKFR